MLSCVNILLQTTKNLKNSQGCEPPLELMQAEDTEVTEEVLSEWARALHKDTESWLKGLNKFQKEQKSPVIVSLSKMNEEIKSTAKKMEEFQLQSKRNSLKMLIKSAQLRSPQHYTSRSWKHLVGKMREAMRIAGNSGASSASLGKAIGILQTGLLGLRQNMPKPNNYKNLKNPLPRERVSQKPKTLVEIFSEKAGEKIKNKFSRELEENLQLATGKYGQAKGTYVDVSSTEVASAEGSESIDMEA